jgi:hypothetical protein
VGYSVGIFADGSSWQIDRSTQNLSLGIVERIYGSGNFSRYNYIKDISGLEFSEKASAVRGGNVSMNESTRFVSIEGRCSSNTPLEALITGWKTMKKSKN